MLKTLPGRWADNLDQATLLAIREAGKGELSPDITTVFASVIDADKLRAEAERSINTAVHSRYGRTAKWYGRPWFIPLPQLRYDARPIPQVTFAVQVYLVSSITVETPDYSYHATLVGTTGKPEKLTLPISFL
jgi:hypothetical protein